MLGFIVFSLGLALISLLDLGFVLGVMVYDYGFHYGFFGHLHDRSNFGGILYVLLPILLSHGGDSFKMPLEVVGKPRAPFFGIGMTHLRLHASGTTPPL